MKEREKGTLLFLDELNEWEREKRDVGEEGERYKYPQPQRSLKSWQCRGSSVVVPHCGSQRRAQDLDHGYSKFQMARKIDNLNCSFIT